MTMSGKSLNITLAGRQVIFLVSGIMLLLFCLLFLLDPSGLQKDLFYNRGNDLFADFLNSVRHVAAGNPYRDGHIQPPLGYLILMPFTLFSDFSRPLFELWNSPGAMAAAWVFAGISEICFAGAMYAVCRKKKCPQALFWTIFSGVNIAAIERGTTVILAAGCVAGFFALYEKEKSFQRLGALFLLSAAGALKIYPAVFSLVLIKERDFKALLWCALFAVLLGLLPFFCFPDGLENIPRLLKNLEVYRQTFALSYVDLKVIHSWRSDFGMARAADCYRVFRRVADVFVLCSCALLFFSRKKEDLVFAAACAVTLCPAGAMNYTLLYFATPFAEFCSKADGEKIYAFAALCLAAVYTPLRFACQLNTVLSVVLPCTVLLALLCRRVQHRELEFFFRIKTES